jgi:hypothetical protein
MNVERQLRNIQVALKQINWYSLDERIDYNMDVSRGELFLDGTVLLFNDTMLEFTESITPERRRYRYQFMKKDGTLIFRYDNVPHHRQLLTFPHHKHYPNQVVESNSVDFLHFIKEVIMNII